MKTKQQRKAIYLKVAKEFEDGIQKHGICYAFDKFCENVDGYYPSSLIREFPELIIVFISLGEHGKIKKNTYVYKGIGNIASNREGWGLRATLLCLAANLCDKPL